MSTPGQEPDWFIELRRLYISTKGKHTKVKCPDCGQILSFDEEGHWCPDLECGYAIYY